MSCPNMPAADCGVYFSFYTGLKWATQKENHIFALVVLDGDIALRDTDGDGLTDGAEVSSGTNPNLLDSDGDGLVDGVGGIVPVSSVPGSIDCDLDGFVDGEQDYGTDPVNSDTDHDGISDGIEVQNGSDPLDINSYPALSDGDLAPYGSPDGNINAADILIAVRIVLGQLVPRSLEYAHGDMNADGVINLADILIITKIVLY